MHFRVEELAAAAAVAAADRPICRRVWTEAGSSRSVREARGSRVSAVAAAARCPCRVRPRGPPTVAVRFVYGLPGGLGLRRAGRGSVRRTDGAEASSRIPGRPAATQRPMGVVPATCLVVREPGLVHKKSVTPSYVVFCPDGLRPGQHHLNLPKLWLVSRLSYSLVRGALAAFSSRRRCWGFTVIVQRGEVTCQCYIAAEWQSQHCSFKPTSSELDF